MFLWLNLCWKIEEPEDAVTFVGAQFTIRGDFSDFTPRSWMPCEVCYFCRIERFWVDVQSACLAVFKQAFIQLENEDALSIENHKQMAVLHRVFLPRINFALKEFMDGWNSHPISSENYFSPQQLMLMHQPPPHYNCVIQNVR